MKHGSGGSHGPPLIPSFNPQHSENIMNRILEVTDEDENLVLEYIDLNDIRAERILPIPA